MEIDPKYVTATIYRYRAMFPEQPVRLVRNGELLDVKQTADMIADQNKVIQ